MWVFFPPKLSFHLATEKALSSQSCKVNDWTSLLWVISNALLVGSWGVFLFSHVESAPLFSLLMQEHTYCDDNRKCSWGSFQRPDSSLFVSNPNFETNQIELQILDRLESVHFKYFRPAWEQMHDLILLSCAWFIFKSMHLAESLPPSHSQEGTGKLLKQLLRRWMAGFFFLGGTRQA